jgi:hypothetical protein
MTRPIGVAPPAIGSVFLPAMGFNRRKMEDQRRQAVEKETAAACY